ncbi:hypothetical protein JCM19239_4342 [Vibrio variabilis]|uniref:Uncharacterized protein n=1 Tax=Vibrio variabilis TaxID=990271 RepID=A0ABQ0JE18_9VIBR|nr:hypothetical protein JCM19239_4342 [Vibrio variabilis]
MDSVILSIKRANQMKKVILAVAISSLSFGAIANSNYTGHRIGAGLSV